MLNLPQDAFLHAVAAARATGERRTLVAPIIRSLIADHLTPTTAYRRLVAPDDRLAPSFLLESVEQGERQGRYSILASRPRRLLTAAADTTREDRADASPLHHTGDPFVVMRDSLASRTLLPVPGVPSCFFGGWVGYASYDSVRYALPTVLPFSAAPRDDRRLPDLSFGWYDAVTIFDHAQRLVRLVALAEVPHGADPAADPAASFAAACAELDARVRLLERHTEPLHLGLLAPASPSPKPLPSNLSREQHAAMVARAKAYIAAGDIFQVVLGQRFERTSRVDPFDVYRALRTVNPSPYMVYLQAGSCVLVGSSPEILCRVRPTTDARGNRRLRVTNRPLAGTRPRGSTADADLALEHELRADPKERAEHAMLVDLGRNDVGVVSEPGTVSLDALMDVERYSHVMHLSSTITGLLRPDLDAWDALRAALPAGTISGAPKIRAMQIIDELEPIRRGPYGGGMGYVALDGSMDIALTLRTMVVTRKAPGEPWTYHLQAAGGIVADSDTSAEYQETVNKAAALARAIDLAESAFPPAAHAPGA